MLLVAIDGLMLVNPVDSGESYSPTVGEYEVNHTPELKTKMFIVCSY